MGHLWSCYGTRFWSCYGTTLNVNIQEQKKIKRPECYYQRISHKQNLFDVYFLDFLFCFLFSLANSFFLESSAFFSSFSFLLVSFSKNFCCLLFSSSILFCSTALCFSTNANFFVLSSCSLAGVVSRLRHGVQCSVSN